MLALQSPAILVYIEVKHMGCQDPINLYGSYFASLCSLVLKIKRLDQRGSRGSRDGPWMVNGCRRNSAPNGAAMSARRQYNPARVPGDSRWVIHRLMDVSISVDQGKAILSWSICKLSEQQSPCGPEAGALCFTSMYGINDGLGKS